MKLSRRRWIVLLAILLGLVPLTLISTDSALAQTEEQDLIPELENEWDTGFERSDSGNVAQTARTEYAEGSRNLSQARKLRIRIAETDDPEKRGQARREDGGHLRERGQLVYRRDRLRPEDVGGLCRSR